MRKVLVLTEDRAMAATLLEHLAGRAEVTVAPQGRAAQEFISFKPQAVIVDLDSEWGMKGLEELRPVDSGSGVIALSSRRELESTVEAMRKGAFDRLTSPIDLAELDECLERVFRGFELHAGLKDMVAGPDGRATESIVGRSRAMEAIFKAIGVASEAKVTVLIQGESGTGKELIARAIHGSSLEKDRPFVAINCSALVENLLESELFGHEKGAFTGALSRKEGKFEAACGGTVFLDEIGEMSQALQVKLLRVLQERSFERVGGSESIRTDVRVIAATNRDLWELTAAGGFREDLFYRLKVITIEIPPLRQRKEDIAPLVEHLLRKANRELRKSVTKVPAEVIDRLAAYAWPGNVRELENVMTRAVLLARGDVLIDITLGEQGRTAAKEPGQGPWSPAPLAEVEATHVRMTLERAGWNKSRAAAMLGVSLPRLRRKIKGYGLRPP